MTTEEFANVGVFVTALVGYLLATGLIGCFGSDWLKGDDFSCAYAWLSGAFFFAVAVTVMRG